MRRLTVGICIGLVLAPAIAIAAEPITYTYDAKGRLVKVIRTETVYNNVTYDYMHGKANNRKNVKVMNSPNVPPP